MTELTDEQLATLLAEMNAEAVGHLSDQVSTDQDELLDRYLGKPDGTEVEGESTAVSMDVAEIVDWALPDLLEPFISGDRAVEYEPNGRNDDEWIEDATILANHVFYGENDGVTVLYDTIKTALIQKIGFVKTWWEPTETVRTEQMEGLSLATLQEMLQQEDVEITSAESEPVNPSSLPEDALAAFSDGMSYTVTITRRVVGGQVRLASCAPEEIKVSARAASLQDIDYVAHETEIPRWRLVGMGFDREAVEGLASEPQTAETSRSDTRFDGETEATRAARRDLLLDQVTLVEEYPILDLDGTGHKRWQVYRVGGTILGKQVVEDHPFDCWTADRIPHRLIGLSVADKVRQTQAVKTALLRDMLNNLYLANRPRMEVPEEAIGENTIEDLLTMRVGGLIRTTRPGMLTPIQTPDRTGAALSAITYMDSVREQQSGITRNGMAISSEVVDPKSAQESRRQDRNEQTRKRLMCRMIAETLLVPIFQKVLRLLVAYQDVEKQIKVSGRWTEMMPSAWDANVRARAAVGLGHSNREEQLMAATTVLGIQDRGREMGLVVPKHLYKTASKLIQAVGWQDPSDYFLDPDSPEGQTAMQQLAEQAGRDPATEAKAAEGQAKMQLEQMRAGAEAQRRQAELDVRARAAEIKAAMDAQIAERKLEHEREVAAMRIASEQEIARERMRAEMALSRYEIDSRPEPAGGPVRFGGKIG